MQRPRPETVTLNDVLITEELACRSPRSPNWQAEAEAMSLLSRQMVRDPNRLLQTLVATAIDLCQAHTAGVSLLAATPSGELNFRWQAIAGTLSPYLGRVVPYSASCCTVCLEQNGPLLFAHPERYFVYCQAVDVPIVEALILPLVADDHRWGTIWILSHDEQRRFDSEDLRVMTSLADFTAAALLLDRQQAQNLLTANAPLEAEIARRIATEMALRQAEERNRVVLEAAELATWDWNLLSDRVIWNEQHYRLLGIEPPKQGSWERSSASFLQFVEPEDQPLVQRGLERAVTETGVYQAEFRIIRADTGEQRWMSGYGRVIETRDDQAIRMSGVMYDSTDRHQAEDTLRASEERLRLAAQAANFGTYDYDLRTDQLIWSPLLKAMHGLPADAEVRFDQLSELIHPDDRAPVLQKFAQFLSPSGPDSYRHEFRIQRSDGNTRWLLDQGRVFYSGKGQDRKADRAIGVILDITERKRAEAILAADLQDTQLLHQLSTRLLGEDNPQVLYDEIMTTAIALMQADGGTVQILDPATQDLLLLATQGIDQPMTTHFYRVSASSNTPCGMALQSGIRVFVDFDNPAQADPDGSLRLHREAGYLSAQSTPLIARSGQPIGMVSTHWRHHHRPSEHKLRFLDLLARQAADLIKQQRAEVALRQSEAKYRMLFDSIDQAFCLIEMIFDEQGQPVDFLYLETNPAFVKHAGQPLVGKRIREITPNFEQFWLDQYGHVATTGEAIRLEHVVQGLDNQWFETSAFRYGDEASHSVSVLLTNITERKRTEATLRTSEARQGFLLKLSDALRQLSAAAEIQYQAARVLGEHLGANRVGYAEAEDDETIVVTRNYTNGVSGIEGRYHYDDYGPELLREFKAGRTVVRHDIANDPTLSDQEKAAHAVLQLGATVNAPLLKAGCLVAVLFVHFRQAHHWSADELDLIQEVVERIWDAVERSRVEMALRDSEQRLSVLFAQAAVGLCELSLEGRFLQVNDALCRLLGRSRQELLAASLADMIDPDDLPASLAAFARLIATGEPISLDKRYRRPDGTIWANSILTRLDDRQGQPHHVLAVTIDLSDRKQAEANRIQLIREQAAHREERQRAETLAELDRAKTLFFSNISHEFRTPLTLILDPLQEAITALEAMERQAASSLHPAPLPPTLSPTFLRQQLQIAHRNSLRLLKLVNMLLDFSRIEMGRMKATYEPTDLAAFTTDLASVFRTAIEQAGLQLIVDCPALPEPVYVDRQMWETIVLNLLSNAFKFTFEGEIRVSLQARGDRVALTVSDTGRGIPAAALPHLFERFYQVKGLQGRSDEGSGIGLALVQEFVQLNRGTISVQSTIDQGTQFTITLPLGIANLPPDQIIPANPLPPQSIVKNAYIEEARRWLPQPETTDWSANLAAIPALQPQSEAASPAHPPAHPPARILLADDNADMRDYLMHLLSPLYRVNAVGDGRAAWEAILQQPPDLVLADVMMPGINGLELLQALRSHPQTREIPIILLSARAGEPSRLEGLELGADDYLIKPFSARELLTQVESNLKLTRMRREVATQNEVRRVVQSLNENLELRVKERTTQLEAINQELEAFSYSVSHDLRAPLRYINSFAEQLRRRLESSHWDDIGLQQVNIIIQAAIEAETLVDNLLEFSHAGRSSMHFSQIAMNALVQQVREQLQSEMVGRVVTWQIAPLPEVEGDPLLLQLVLQNLLSNALKYTRDRDEAVITIDSLEQDNEYIFWIKDNGAGFNMQYYDRLFNLFQRLHSQTEFAGTGIGLANVRRIIHRHGGRTWAEGEIDRGTTFYFSLPQRGT